MPGSTEKQTFGELLKKTRVEQACIGLRAFADLVNMKPSDLSGLERGRIPPPTNRKVIVRICKALGLPRKDARRTRLFDLAAETKNPTLADNNVGKTKPGFPVLVRSVANKQLSEKKFRDLAEYIKKFYRGFS